MTAKMDQFPAINSNPLFNVGKDGTVLYSNEASEPLLHEWGLKTGEKLPPHIEIFVQRAISREGIEKIELKVGKRIYLIIFHPLPEQECTNIYGFDITDRKEPEGNLRESETQEKANLELANIINAKAVQSLMNDFYRLAHIPIALLDLNGNILVSAGWQEICTRFHRVNPETCKYCVESDINLTAGAVPGGYKLYKCKNNMWDVVTPIIVEGQYIGNVFSGQFLFNNEPLDYELFRAQARKYGFNEEEYIAALEKVPRLSREAVDTSMAFFMTFANMISQLSYSNIKLSQSLAEHDAVVDALQGSEKRERARSEELTAVLDAVPVAVFIAHDPRALQLTGNRLSYEWLRVPVGTNFSKSAPEGERPEMFELFKDGREIPPENMPSQMAAAGREVNNCELDIVSADGEIRHVLGNARPLLDEQGNPRGSVSAFIDITEREKAEEAIRLSNLYNRSLIEASLDPLVTIGPDGKITDVNNSTETITGLSRDELIGADFSDYFTEPEKAREGYQRAFKEGLVRDYSLEIQHKDGHVTPVLYNASVYRDENGKVIGVFAAARDIAAVKKAEEKIQILANAVESSNDAIITKSLDGIIASWNKGAEKVYGYLAEEVLGKNISTLEPDNTKGETKHLIEKIRQGERVRHYETLRMKKDGTIINISITLSPVFDASGKLVAISTIARDITDNKKAEEAIRLSNLYNRSLIEAGLDPLVTIGRNGKITDVNGATEQVTGYSRNDLVGTDFSDYFTEPEKARAGYQQVFTDGEVRNYPLEIRHKDGHITPVLYNASVYRDENGEVIGVFAAARDITERKKAEEDLKKVHGNLEKLVEERTTQLEKAYSSLKESEEGLAEAQKMAHIGNWSWDIVTGETYWSQGLYRIFGLNPQQLSTTYNDFLGYVHPDDRDFVDNAIKKALNENPFGIDYRIITVSGEERTVHAESEVTFNPNNIPIRAKGIIQDITERKEAEEALANIETARKKEIHHRIKNNLQVISSLLDLQADKFDNPRVIEAFRESQNRVISMALIHEELYKGKGNDTLDFSTYIRELAENLFRTYSLTSKNICLRMDMEENVFLNMDSGVPLGIIVNELVSNSLKHAFSGKDRGEILIKLCREKNGKRKKEDDKATSFILIVSDNGIGIPENLNIENIDSLGIQLINTLVDQLDGELELTRGNGTEFTIKFAVTEKNNQASNPAI
ncbi:PAS domain S-box protein [Methanosarcina sp. T3]|uniref:PAS domain S-box protein n=1 Tax=Methanosarcina sp. T3 TaxID=3439062 RepID=UPI003F87CF09